MGDSFQYSFPGEPMIGEALAGIQSMKLSHKQLDTAEKTNAFPFFTLYKKCSKSERKANTQGEQDRTSLSASTLLVSSMLPLRYRHPL